MTTYSLTRRIAVTVLAVEILCAAGSSGVALWHEWRTRIRAIDTNLRGRSDSLLGAIQDAEDPGDNVLIDPTELRLPESDFFAVYDGSGRLLGGPLRTAGALTSPEGAGYRSASSDGRSYRVYERRALRIIDRAETGGAGLRRPVTIVYAMPTGPVWREVLEAAGFYAVLSVLLAGGTVLLLLLLIRRFLRPIGDLAGAAAAISPGALAFVPPSSAARTRELLPLVEALGDMVARVREGFEREHRFLGDAAHELKTAVAVVRSTVQVLGLRERSPEEYRRGMAAVLRDNERVELLVSRMLTLAHAEENHAFVATPEDLAEAAQKTVEELSTYAETRGVTVRTALREGAFVRLAEEEARTLISNLLVNAVQHSPAGGSVEVRVKVVTAAHVNLEVEDWGEGIRPEDLPYVFDRFYRSDSSRSRETGGAGLGLAICKGLVEAAGGTVFLDSTAGQGTCARVSLPLARVGSEAGSGLQPRS